MSIRKRPSKKTKSGYTYQVYFPYVDEDGVSKKFIKGGFTTKKEAQEYEVLKRKEIKDYGSYSFTAHLTFNDVFEEYMKVEGNKYALSTKQYYWKSYNLYIKDSIGKRQILTLKYKDIQKYFNELKCNYDTVKNIKKVFGVTFTYAIKNSYIKENTMKLVTIQIQKPNTKKKEKPTITREQLNRVLEEMLIIKKNVPDRTYTEFNYQAYAVAIFIGWFTGLRISETLGLRKEDFDFENNTININRRLEYHLLTKDKLYTTEKLKTSSSKAVIPLAEELKEGLKIWFNKNPYDQVICDIHGRYIHPHTFQARIREVNLNLDFYFHYHMLRHSFTSHLISNGVTPNIAKELVRHKDITTTLGIYTHVQEQEKTDALQKVFG